MADDFKYDVFISYSHKDEEQVVDSLLLGLEDADLKVCDYCHGFETGSPIVMEMEHAILESHKAIPHTFPCLFEKWLGCIK